jgi:hypothetical protein
MANAPIALFVYKRPEHTRRMLESLRQNPEADRSPVFAFCDGPRSEKDAAAVAEARAAVRASGLRDLRVVERPHNLGLARSVIAGVSAVCEEYGTAIVVEDDLILAPTFLSFMNAALETYRDVPSVHSVSGYMFPVDLADLGLDAVFLPLTSSWGWATWQRAWKAFAPGERSHAAIAADPALRQRFDVGGYPFFSMLEAQLRGKVDSWGIRWYATVFLQNGLTLFPARSLVANEGFDGSGVHCGSGAPAHASASASHFTVTHFPPAVSHAEALRRVASVIAPPPPVSRTRDFARMLLRALSPARGRAGP